MPAETCIMGLFRGRRQGRQGHSGPGRGGVQLPPRPQPHPQPPDPGGPETQERPRGLVHAGGGLLGFFTGFALAIFTAVQWDLIVSGKPIISLIPFFIVGFEFTILFSVFGNVIGLLVCSRLPDYRGLETLRSALLGRALRGARGLRGRPRGRVDGFLPKAGRGGQGIRMNTTMPPDLPAAGPAAALPFHVRGGVDRRGLAAFLVGVFSEHPQSAWQAFPHQFSVVVGHGPGRGAFRGRHPHVKARWAALSAGCPVPLPGFSRCPSAVSWSFCSERHLFPGARRPARQGDLAEHPVPVHP